MSGEPGLHSPSALEQHYTTRELAALLSVHPETVRREAARGRLRSVRVGAERRYPQSAVEAWLREDEDAA